MGGVRGTAVDRQGALGARFRPSLAWGTTLPVLGRKIEILTRVLGQKRMC